MWHIVSDLQILNNLLSFPLPFIKNGETRIQNQVILVRRPLFLAPHWLFSNMCWSRGLLESRNSKISPSNGSAILTKKLFINNIISWWWLKKNIIHIFCSTKWIYGDHINRAESNIQKTIMKTSRSEKKSGKAWKININTAFA